MVREAWERIGPMAPGWIPAVWRDSRLMYRLGVDSPIGSTSSRPESIAVGNYELGPQLAAITDSLSSS